LKLLFFLEGLSYSQLYWLFLYARCRVQVGLGEILKGYLYWKGWRSLWKRGRKANQEAIEDLLNQIRISGKTVSETEEVERVPIMESKSKSFTDSELYEKERQVGIEIHHW